MQSLWNDAEASQFSDELGLRVYTSRLLGREPNLVLHGGGNTSVKISERDLLGELETLLYVKGSGWDLERIDRAGFSPVRLKRLLQLAELESLSDPQMVNELRTHMTWASAPTPSVEAILHAILPHKFVDHTHADAVVTITNTREGYKRIQDIYGDSVVIIDYIMPGFDLARQCARQFPLVAHADTLGMVLMNHGIFSFAESARESYERMIDLVSKAEEYLKKRNAWVLPGAQPKAKSASLRVETAALRREISRAAGNAMLLCAANDDESLAFAQRADVGSIANRGPATPDHVIRTKQKPLVGRDVAQYGVDYKHYFDTHAPSAREPKTMLDRAPRLVLDPQLGMLCAGRSAKDAAIVRDIYRNTIEVILRAEALGGYVALSDRDIFDMEYWDLEQAKLRGGAKASSFAGEVALVTGAASGIGKACVDSLLARGAAVIGVDVNPNITSLYPRADFCGIVCDVAEEAQVVTAIEQGVCAFGGLDMLVLNAGLFPAGCRLESLQLDAWRQIMRVNVDANVVFLRECFPLLKLAPKAGRVVVIGSKNVLAPGPGAAAYSASKAALTQLARIAALEWGGDNIRVNVLHPDAVFDTGIWTDEVLNGRAAHYGLTVQQYKTKNVLKVEVLSRDVAELAAEMCGTLFGKTTGAQLPVDGGNDRVI